MSRDELRPSVDVASGVSSLEPALVRWCAELTHQGVFATDRHFRILLWNRWMEIHSGRTAADVLGQSLFHLFPEIEARGLDEHYRAALEGRVTVLSHGLHHYLIAVPPTNQDLQGREMPQTGRISPLTGERIIGTITVIDDVSERLAAEAELRRQIDAQRLARSTAEEALRAKDDFLSTLSHEMRTPLNAVLGWARILIGREDVDRELLNRALHVIERNASAQAKMIDDLLDMARIVAGKVRLDIQPIDLLGVVLAAVDVVMPSANAKRVTVRTSLDPKTQRVLGDHERLQQIVWNLLSNALKFTEPGGTIDVRLEPAANAARIVVSDNGRGIHPEFLPYVFERFRQSDASSARRHGGLGLGLALVLELVELHGGRVRAESAGENKGSTFTIELPVIVSPEIRRNHHDLDSRRQPVSLHEVRVMVVEDEVDARRMTVTALEHCGAHVIAVSSCAEAFEAFLAAPAEARPHVIVSDIGMPGEDGYSLIRRIRALERERGGGIPALAVTGYATVDDVERVLAAGYQIHIPKPIDPVALASAVATLAARTGTSSRE